MMARFGFPENASGVGERFLVEIQEAEFGEVRDVVLGDKFLNLARRAATEIIK